MPRQRHGKPWATQQLSKRTSWWDAEEEDEGGACCQPADTGMLGNPDVLGGGRPYAGPETLLPAVGMLPDIIDTFLNGSKGVARGLGVDGLEKSCAMGVPGRLAVSPRTACVLLCLSCSRRCGRRQY